MRSLVAAIIFAILPHTSYATKIVGNGGDFHALEFVVAGMKALDQLEQHPIAGIDTDLLHKTIDETMVESTDELLFLGNTPKDAINYPSEISGERRIVFNRSAWDRQPSELAKIAFSLHEYLGIMEVNDSRYQFSKLILLNNTHFINEWNQERKNQ